MAVQILLLNIKTKLLNLLCLCLIFLDVENCKACVAAITFILKNATCHAISQNYLSNELQQV